MLRQPLSARAVSEAREAPERVQRREAARRRRRAGVLIPLFSIRTASSWGVGEVPDLGRFARWAGRAGFSLLQMLPVNETSGADASPYAASSAFAIDPVYLSLGACEDFTAAGGTDALASDVRELLARARAAPLVEWQDVRRVKQAAIALAFERFRRDEWQKDTRRALELRDFMRAHANWLDAHALYRVWHDQFGTSWVEWPAEARDRDPTAVAALRRDRADDLLRVKWTQWQLDRQWRSARRAASAEGVELMGDLPFVVGLDSADVWAYRELFRTDLRVGTPPEPGAPQGQDWGLPAYDWPALARQRFSWIRERSMRAGALFSIYRVDHAMGFYRTYVRAADGRWVGFSPGDEREQVEQGETLMRIMGSRAEVVAEDLGAVPAFLRPSLERVGVPGYRVLRWEKDGEDFRDPAAWPELSVATTSTHDTDALAVWFESLGPEARERLRRVPGLGDLPSAGPFDERTRDLLLRAVYAAPSTLAIVTLQDALGTRERINTPGNADGQDWRYRAGKTVEELLEDQSTTDRLARLAAESGRAPVRGPTR
ncbi:MAG TPA: 4-alpha-glucanotransferase [Polyangia bacterium]|nr:4-alpha-glucanotransferase [Polyangia bacterium]